MLVAHCYWPYTLNSLRNVKRQARNDDKSLVKHVYMMITRGSCDLYASFALCRVTQPAQGCKSI